MFKRWSMIIAIAALLMLAVGPVAAGSGGTDRPFKAQLVGEITFEFGSSECSAISPVVTLTDSWGEATHMGQVHMNWAHCPLDIGFVNGHAEIFAANGDALYLEFENIEGGNTFEALVAGGTGRFDGATGTVEVTFAVEPAFVPGCEIDPTDPFPCLDFFTPWGWSGTINGTISY